jgi:shikimate dehydrogenase
VNDRYVVIGNPIAHSKSPQIHARFAEQTSQSIEYERLLAPLDAFDQTLKSLIASGGRGANVTVPFKLDAFRAATQLSPRARAAEAVNTLRFDAGEIFGDNTDGVGLVRDIRHNAKFAISGKTVLLLGAGGAARGVIQALLAESPSQLVIANRTPERANALFEQFAHEAKGVLQASSFADLQSNFDLIINATSASLASELPAVPASLFASQSFVYDMMYSSHPTLFMQLAESHGAMTRDGLGMLVEQAAESFFVWRGVRPETASVYQWLRTQL